jgi:protease-4
LQAPVYQRKELLPSLSLPLVRPAQLRSKDDQQHSMSQASVVAARGPISRLTRFAGRTLQSTLAVVGVAALGAGYYEYQSIRPALWEDYNEKKNASIQKDGDTKKKVLVIPFHRLQLVERKKSEYFSSLEKISGDDADQDRVLPMELRELVDLLHQAAADPEISALYGIFGHGSALSSSGWADLEEVRNALKVFRQSHRRHAEPNIGHEELIIPRIDSKPMYAYADTFASLGDPGNKDYYVASIFSHIHMQQSGELNLFGLTSQQMFMRGLLEKYGINVHVFKHGKYKNAPNGLTEWGFNRAHRENVTNLVESLNADICDDIQASRSKALLTSWLRKDGDIWKRIQNAGTFPALTAWKSGLVDYIPRKGPLFDLLEANLDKVKKEEYKATWKHQETDFDRFHADETIDLKDYAKKVSKRKKADSRVQSWHALAESRPEISKVLSSLGVRSSVAEEKPKEKIALLHVEGGIVDATAAKMLKTIHKIKKDGSTKCLVVRVTSPGGAIHACETISEELKSLNIPVVFSFGNVSASGGYYIASCADRIFASKKTITGSIGVFAIRPDFTEFAARYGVNFEHVSASEYGASLSPFHPMTRKMKENISQSIDRYYKHFKGVVADGRGLSPEIVEAIAQGRVWTGDQAKSNGLVDEVGGLYRALAYAQREYTSGDAKIVVWPKKQTLFEKLAEAGEAKSLVQVGDLIRQWMASGEPKPLARQESPEVLAQRLVGLLQDPSSARKMMGNVMLAADENTAIQLLLQDAGAADAPLLPDGFWR